MLNAGAARAVVNPPLTIEQGVWGAKSHVTPSGIEADFFVTCLVLSDDEQTAVLIGLDLCTIPKERADHIRHEVASALKITPVNVRVSVTHTHAGPVLRADHHAPNREAELNYIDFLTEQCVSAAIQAASRSVPVSVQSGYGTCSIGKSRRQRLDDGLMVAGYNPDGANDPTVTAVGFRDGSGELIASIAHYAAHPTTLGYTNDLLSPDYPGVTRRVVEQMVGGTCVFLQGAAGNVGPGPGGFLSNIDVMRSIGTQLGCATSQTLLESAEQQFDVAYQKLVRSGADLGVWSRSRRPLSDISLQVRSEMIALPVRSYPAPDIAQQRADELFSRWEQLQQGGAPTENIRDARFRWRRATMELDMAKKFHGRTTYDVEIHVITIGDTALVGIPIEPFCEIGIEIRNRSPYPFTLFGGYTNGANGYLPTAEAAAIGGYEVDQMAFAHNSADLLTEEVVRVLKEMAAG
jgi:hypothetical protein